MPPVTAQGQCLGLQGLQVAQGFAVWKEAVVALGPATLCCLLSEQMTPQFSRGCYVSLVWAVAWCVWFSALPQSQEECWVQGRPLC